MIGELVRSARAGLGCKALATGLRLPDSNSARAFGQWGQLIDVTRRLGINVFLDVGANRGYFSKYLRKSGYSGHLFSFEPIPEDFRSIQTMATNDPLWSAYCYALGSESGRQDFHINHCDGDQTVLSSFLPLRQQSSWVSDRSKQSNATHTIAVDVRRLDEILPELIEGIDSPRVFLKMDTQGFDSRVIEGANRIIDKIVGIQSEISVIPIYEGMAHYTESLASYEKLGFGLVDLFVVTRLDGFVMEYDCVMARRNAITPNTGNV